MALAVTLGSTSPGSTGPVTVTLPSHATDDLLLLFGYQRASATALTVTTATGWTSILTAQDTTYGAIGAWYKKATSGSETNPVVTGNTTAGSTMIGMSMKVTGQDLTTPIDVAGAGQTYTAPSTPFDLAATTAVTTATDNAWVFILYGSGDDNSWDISAGWTGVNQAASTLGTDASIAVVRKAVATAGSSGTNVERQIANGGDAARSISFAIREATVVAGTFPDRIRMKGFEAVHRSSRW